MIWLPAPVLNSGNEVAPATSFDNLLGTRFIMLDWSLVPVPGYRAVAWFRFPTLKRVVVPAAVQRITYDVATRAVPGCNAYEGCNYCKWYKYSSLLQCSLLVLVVKRAC